MSQMCKCDLMKLAVPFLSPTYTDAAVSDLKYWNSRPICCCF